MPSIYTESDFNQSLDRYKTAIRDFETILEPPMEQVIDITYSEKTKEPENPDERLKKISEIVDRELKNLEEYSRYAEKMNKQLEKTGCCTRMPMSVYVIGSNNAVLGALRITGFVLAVIEESAAATYTGIALFTLGEALTALSATYEFKKTVEMDRIKLVGRINQEMKADFKTFKDFLDKLKELRNIQEHEKRNLEHYERSLHNNIPVPREEVDSDRQRSNLDSDPVQIKERLEKCLDEYFKLSDATRNDEQYCRLLSYIIKNLPDNHPLKEGIEYLASDDLYTEENEHHEGSQDFIPTGSYLPPSLHRTATPPGQMPVKLTSSGHSGGWGPTEGSTRTMPHTQASFSFFPDQAGGAPRGKTDFVDLLARYGAKTPPKYIDTSGGKRLYFNGITTDSPIPL